MDGGGSSLRDRHKLAKRRGWRGIELRQPPGGRRNHRLLGAAWPAALASRGQRQVAAVGHIRRLQPSDYEQIHQQRRYQRNRDDAAVPES